MTLRGLLVGSALLALAIAGLALWAWQGITVDARAYAASGVPVEARVLDKRQTSRLRQGKGYLADTWQATVRYNALDGSARTWTAPVSGAFFERLDPGATITVLQIPDRPDQVEIEPGWTEGNGVAAMATGLGFAGLGLLGLFAAFRVGAAGRAIATRGVLTRGRVTEHVRLGERVVVRYGYGDLGAVHRGATPPLTPDEARALPPGTEIDLLVDPRRPSRSMRPRDLRGPPPRLRDIAPTDAGFD